jgi:ADP-heptose:LPS heptosyltransferase
MVQLARLGDLLQTVPAITAITAADPALEVDLLCPAPLAPIGRMLPGIAKVLEWDGMAWRQQAQAAGAGLAPEHISEADRLVSLLSPQRYDRAYVLNQHPHALLAGALLARETVGPRREGPLDGQLTPWAAYIREVAITGKGRRVHLADGFCGLCGVQPADQPAIMRRPACALPGDLDEIGRSEGLWVGLIVGAGDMERVVPVETWRRWIARFLEQDRRGRVVLIGQERERGVQLLDALPPSMLGRVWDATGRTSLTELAEVVTRCHRVIGSDTGPLHLAAALGVRVIGWYFARACVHQTGPYGPGHLIWQAEGVKHETFNVRLDREDLRRIALPGTGHVASVHWPIEETVQALVQGEPQQAAGWTVWTSHYDRWGAYYTEAHHNPIPPHERETLWRHMCPAVR